MKVSIDKDVCIKCGTCVLLCPENFEFVDDEINIKDDGLNVSMTDDLKHSLDACPVGAISVVE